MQLAGQPVIFVSHALTSMVAKYSQTELEFLAMVFATVRCKVYIVKRTFTSETDGLPILGLCHEASDLLSGRLQQRLIQLQQTLTGFISKEDMIYLPVLFQEILLGWHPRVQKQQSTRHAFY